METAEERLCEVADFRCRCTREGHVRTQKRPSREEANTWSQRDPVEAIHRATMSKKAAELDEGKTCQADSDGGEEKSQRNQTPRDACSQRAVESHGSSGCHDTDGKRNSFEKRELAAKFACLLFHRLPPAA